MLKKASCCTTACFMDPLNMAVRPATECSTNLSPKLNGVLSQSSSSWHRDRVPALIGAAQRPPGRHAALFAATQTSRKTILSDQPVERPIRSLGEFPTTAVDPTT